MLEQFEYNEKSPSFLIWTISKGGKAKGQQAGYKRKSGYFYLETNNKAYACHDVVWLLHNGDIPIGYCVDHIDGNPSNNLIGNLRLATKSENACNKTMPPNSSGVKGVSWDNKRQSYSVRVTKHGKVVFGGWFKDLNEATIKVEKLRKELHGDFARFN